MRSVSVSYVWSMDYGESFEIYVASIISKLLYLGVCMCVWTSPHMLTCVVLQIIICFNHLSVFSCVRLGAKGPFDYTTQNTQHKYISKLFLFIFFIFLFLNLTCDI